MAEGGEEQLAIEVIAKLNALEKQMAKASGITAKAYREMSQGSRRATRQMEDDTIRATARINQALAATSGRIGLYGKAAIASLGGIGAALSAREVIAYADAWTAAKNSLAVAGVVGDKQADILDRLYQSAQANAAPLSAMASLYGKAAQASDNLGASQAELLKFSDGVAVALRVAGTSSTEAAGALTQLGQLLGSARVQAEEFNSVNDGARPILMAVAAGLDDAGGSVSKLKQLVNDGKVSGQEFFQAFLRGLPQIQKMAANATQTIDQGFTKVSNAFMRYIGQTDESLEGSQRLVAGLNALADNFDQTADVTLKLAGILAGALVGRGIGAMVATIPNAIGLVMSLTAAIRAGTLTAAGLGAALGPLGLIAGAVAAATLAFGKWGDSIDDATRSLADQAASGSAIEGMIADVSKAQEAYKSAIANTAGAQTSATNSIVADTKKEFEAKKSLLELEMKRQQALVAVSRAALADKSAALKAEVGGAVNIDLGRAERGGFSDPRVGNFVRLPDDITGLDKTRETIANSPLTAEIQKLRAEIDLAELSTEKLNDALGTTFSDKSGGKGGAGAAGGSGKGGAAQKADDYERMARRIAEATAATLAEAEAQKALNPTIEDYGYAIERARAQHELLTAAKEAGRKITPELAAEIEQLSEAYAQAEVSANKLTEAQQKARDDVQYTMDASRDALGDLKNALDDGKLSWDEFADVAMNALDRIIDKMLDDLVGAFDHVGGSGGGLFGFLGGIFGGGAKSDPWAGMRDVSLPKFAKGGVSDTPAIFAEAGPEAAVPLPDGRRIPVDLRDQGKPKSQAEDRPSLMQVELSEDLVGRILEQSNSHTVQLIKRNEAARQNIRQNGGGDW